MAALTEPRPPLSRERILRAALELADEDGIESVTMRKLGQALGFEAMSLYHHVKNKDDLLDGILDLVLEETEPPSTELDWVSSVRGSAISVNRALRRHPWACTLLMGPGRPRPARLRYMDSLLGHLRRAGVSVEATFHAYHVLAGFIFGFSLWQTTPSYTDTELTNMAGSLETAIDADASPHLWEHAVQHFEP